MSVTAQDESWGKVSPPRKGTPPSVDAGDAARGLGSELRGRWQIPLLLIALVFLGVSVWRLRPKPAPPPFSELWARASALKEATLYEEASRYVETLLADPVRTPEEQARLHRLMAEIIFAHEMGNRVHGRNNCRRILDHTDRSLLAGESFDAAAHRMRGLALEWLGLTLEAVHEHRQSLDKGIENPWEVRQHILQLRRLAHDIPNQDLHTELDGFLAASDVPLDIQFWAAERKIDLYAAEDKHDLAEQFLASHAQRFENSDRRKEYDFLRALAWYHVGRDEDAERLLRSLREQLVPGDPLFAQVGWLLGTILQRAGTPEYALSLFNEVLEKTVPSPSRAACVLGRAECLAEIERFDESIQAYEETIRIASEDPLGTQIELKDVRDSTTAWYQTLYAAGRRAEAMAYLKLAAKLAPPVDLPLQIAYSNRLARLGFELGRSVLSEASAPDQVEAGRAYLLEAGAEYLRLAKLATLDASTVTAALWQAAECFDLAGDRQQMLAVLDTFVREYATDTRVPDALLQMGRAHQAAGELSKAIEYYQRNLIEFPRTPAALSSLIPLADCFRETGAADKAEQTLLRIVTPRPGDSLALITPEAPEYRDALFRLGDLYIQAEQYEKAIARYEEALERYATDPRADVATFHLADSYRKSAARVRADLQDPKNIAFKDTLRSTHQQRLHRAHELFDEVIERYSNRPESELSELDRACRKLSYLYSADCVYDLSLVAGSEDSEPFARSLSMYEKAAWLFQRDPMAMTAYVQIMNCYLRMGQVQQAWMALQRARWALRNIPDEEFQRYDPTQSRAFWEGYLNWLEKKPTFASVALAQAE
ncbi:MAG TPA: tetratricopeptide repeat protein [Phycisphaerae bacterium]|mgnify:FL=1|nr:tetratricopeptide repeat protein [Phycisphaerae bacterium]